VTELTRATTAAGRWSKLVAMVSFRSSPAALVAMVPARSLLALALGLAVGAGCTASSEEVRPPADQLYFPTGIGITPDASALFVGSANSDLRYDSGTITSFTTSAIADVVRAWKADRSVPAATCTQSAGGPCCAVDNAALETLECDEGLFLDDGAGNPRPGATVRVGNFGSAIAVQDTGNGNARLVVPVRGDPSITWIDYDAASHSLSCGGGEGLPLCDDAHRLTYVRGDQDLPAIADEPYGAYADSAGEFAIVTHLTSGTITLIDSPKAGTPMVVDALGGLFSSDISGARGASGVAAHDGVVYVTSRTDPRVHLVTVARPPAQTPFLVPSSYFFLRGVGDNGTLVGDSGDSRGIAFGAGGDRAYVVVRDPPTLQVYDTSKDERGAARNELLGATDICRQASTVLVGDAGGAVGERVFVSCYQSGELYVIDGRNGLRVESVTTVGRGPYGLAFAPADKLLFVSNFLEDSVAVVDADPASPTAYHVILRIGVRP
jgi:DNA-binding beta-propeller fold protein YncE